MTKIDVISGFLGAGKTTLIKKLVDTGYTDERLMIIENEFGEVGIDSAFLKDTSITVSELNSGCICCSLAGDFKAALLRAAEEYRPGRIIIEPSGVGKLSDVLRAVAGAAEGMPELVLGHVAAVVDASKYRLLWDKFGEFYLDQIRSARTLLLSRTQKLSAAQLEETVRLLRKENPSASLVTTPWDRLSGAQILSAMEGGGLERELVRAHGEATHLHGADCACGCHGHHGHGHHAEEVFSSWGAETTRAYTEEALYAILERLDSGDYGAVLRAKGFVPSAGEDWLHFDYVPGEYEVRRGGADVTGRVCVIGSALAADGLHALFGV